MTKKQVHEVASWMGRRSYKARLERFGLARIQEIARENGRLGGRPRGSGKKRKGNKSR